MASLPLHNAIYFLRKQISEAEYICQLPYDDPKVDRWRLTTMNILDGAFGKPDGQMHQNTREYARAFAGTQFIGANREECQRRHQIQTQKGKAILESSIQQLEMFPPPSAQAVPHPYSFYPEIERVSGRLYRHGQYEQAVLEACTRVIEEIKKKSGLDLEGDSLMNLAFGCENRTPIIRFASGQTQDEQTGLTFLFKGIDALRNSGTPTNRFFNEPDRAHEFLAVASLLMRLLDTATINRSADSNSDCRS